MAVTISNFSEDVGGRNRPMKSERPLYISIKGID